MIDWKQIILQNPWWSNKEDFDLLRIKNANMYDYFQAGLYVSNHVITTSLIKEGHLTGFIKVP
jgi:hypothetical protein